MNCLRIAHRGASHDYPENTLLSFRRAIEMGVEYLELDVQITRDGQLVVMHDEQVDRTTNGKGYVHDHTLAEIRELDAGRGEKVPLLNEVLELARNHSIRLLIEVKGVDENVSVEMTDPVLAAIQRAEFVPYCLVTSFYQAPLRRAKILDPRLSLMFDPSPQDGSLTPREICEQTLMAYSNLISYNHKFVTADVMHEVNSLGLALWPWAPDTVDEISKMLDLNVPGIVTNRPDILNATLNAHHQARIGHR